MIDKSKNNRSQWGQIISVSMAGLFLMLTITYSGTSNAAYGVPSETHFDPELMKINESKYLGATIAKDVELVDSEGSEFVMGDMLGLPLIVVFAYFDCDGSCPSIAKALNETVGNIQRWSMGKDFRVLTVSFDKNDTPATQKMFMEHVGFSNGMPNGWTIARVKNPDDISRLTSSVGYKFFWERRDQVFLHPGAFIMLSPEGRATRFLYGKAITSQDLEISITKAFGTELSTSNVINMLIGACYSYNYKEGKYTINYPMYVAVGALVIGITSLIGGSIFMRRRVKV